jgi:hypothetical protein
MDGRPSRWTRALASLRGPRLPGDLHVCPSCASDCVNPLEWDESGTARWTVSLRCGACGYMHDREVSSGDVRRFERALDRGFNAISTAADRLKRELMAGWVDAFAGALQRDLIDVADFARRPVPGPARKYT